MASVLRPAGVAVVLVAATMLGAAPRSAEAAPMPAFRIIEIPFGVALNDRGQVAGAINLADGTHAYVWTPGRGAQDIGGLGNPAYTNVSAINNLGEVVGTTNDSTGARTGYFWDPSTGMQPIPTQSGPSYYSQPAAVNDRQQVTGLDAGGAFVWQPGGTIQPIAGSSYPGGAAINNSGWVAGDRWFVRSNTVYGEAFIWRPRTGQHFVRPAPGFATATPFALNNLGQMAGASQNDVSCGYHCQTAVSHATLWWLGRAVDLGSPPGLNWSTATGMNDFGWIIGRACTMQSGGRCAPPKAVLWFHGIPLDLNGLIPATSGWSLETAKAVNNRGEIIGSGKLAGVERNFLLVPAGSWAEGGL